MNKNTPDYGLLAAIIFLSFIGLLMVYSASNIVASYRFNDSFYFFKRQLLFVSIGFLGLFAMIKIEITKIERATTIFFFISLALLIIVLIPGIGIVRGGARSWIGIGTFSIQPAEVMKLALILLFARFLTSYRLELMFFRNFMVLLLLISGIFLLIMLQPDLGTGVVIIISSVLMIYLSGAPLKYFLWLMIGGALGLAGLILSEPYRIARIFAFIDPWADPLGSGFQGIQSLYAIAPSGIFGLGFNKSMQKHFFLPEPQNDFIFAILVEELGLVGGAVVIITYLFIFIKAIKISARVPHPYLSYLSLGLGTSLFVQVFINIAVVVGLLPVTGITLPIISYGGSSLIFTLISLGLLLNISQYQER